MGAEGFVYVQPDLVLRPLIGDKANHPPVLEQIDSSCVSTGPKRLHVHMGMPPELDRLGIDVVPDSKIKHNGDVLLLDLGRGTRHLLRKYEHLMNIDGVFGFV